MTGRPIPPRAIPFVLLLAGLSFGCAASELSREAQDPMAPRAKYGSVVRLTVQNNDFRDATVYANWEGGTRRRVGLATGKTSTTFTFDWVSHRVWFEADFIAGESFTVDAIDVWEGDHLDLVIMNQG